jgi:hypothetical protein
MAFAHMSDHETSNQRHHAEPDAPWLLQRFALFALFALFAFLCCANRLRLD